VVKALKGAEPTCEEPHIYKIAYRGQMTEWQRFEDAGAVYLQPLRNHTLGATSQFILKRTLNALP
jgi:hypothetical protein